jgi:hypothetical protein
MTPEQLLDTYTIVIALIIAGLVYLFILWLKPRKTSQLVSKNVENLTGAGAILLSLVSIGLSITFAIQLSTNFFIAILFVMAFIGYCVAEFTASFHMGYYWNTRNIGNVFLALSLGAGGVVISILAGQSALQASLDKAETQRMQASDAYQNALATKKAAQEKAATLAIDSSQVDTAHTHLISLEKELSSAQSRHQVAKDKLAACPKNYVTVCIKPANAELSEATEKLAIVQAAVDQERDIINRYERYQNALATVERLNSTPPPIASKADATLPGIRALSIVLGVPAEIVGSYIFLFLAIFGEISSLIMHAFWGHYRAARTHHGGITQSVARISRRLC